MIPCIKNKIRRYFSDRPKLRQWVWFFALWAAGLITVLMITYPVKALIFLAK